MINLLNAIRLLKSNKLVIENYFFMTVLQILNSLFYLLIYPFLIRVLGVDSYGLYVFSLSVVSYFITFVNFGFDMPGVRAVAENPENRDIKEYTLSCIFTSKVYLTLISFCIFCFIVFVVPTFRANKYVFLINFTQILSLILFPQWYFQGIQKMRIVTYIQLGFKILSLPFIFVFISSPTDLLLFVTINSITIILGGISAFLIIKYHHGLSIEWQSLRNVKIVLVDSLPFFWSNAMNTVKLQSTSVFIGFNFNLSSVALYDLANKIYTIPMILTSNINAAIFPKIMVSKNSREIVKRILNVEILISMMVIVGISISGKYFINILGGLSMIDAYPLLVILSFGSFTLLVSSYNYFIFIPNKLYKSIFYNQLTAFAIFFLCLFVGNFFVKDIIIVPLSMVIAGLAEILYCNIVLNNKKLIQ